MSFRGRENPAELPCFRTCTACFRCEDKGRYAKCTSCSGRNDPVLKRDPHDHDDYCNCSWGVLRWRTQEGRLIITQYPGNPYKGSVRFDDKTQDEIEWEQYVYEMREKFDDEHFDPITVDGKSATDWANRQRKGIK